MVDQNQESVQHLGMNKSFFHSTIVKKLVYSLLSILRSSLDSKTILPNSFLNQDFFPKNKTLRGLNLALLNCLYRFLKQTRINEYYTCIKIYIFWVNLNYFTARMILNMTFWGKF